MKIRNPFESDLDEYPELTSLIDVMFLLLIFFLLTTSFDRNKEQTVIDVELPLAQHTQKPVIKDQPVYITVDKLGNYSIEKNHYDKKQIFEELKAQIASSADSLVVICGDRSAPYHSIVFIYDMLQALGVKHFSHQVQ
jgi:biopolymer transport protein ExbD